MVTPWASHGHAVRVDTNGKARVFRDDEAKYLVASVVIALCVVGWTAWYEIAHVNSDSILDTVTAIGQGISVAVAVAILSLASWEAAMVVARRINERRDRAKVEEGRQQTHQEWVEYLERKAKAEAEDREFTEPSPAEKASIQSSP